MWFSNSKKSKYLHKFVTLAEGILCILAMVSRWEYFRQQSKLLNNTLFAYCWTKSRPKIRSNCTVQALYEYDRLQVSKPNIKERIECYITPGNLASANQVRPAFMVIFHSNDCSNDSRKLLCYGNNASNKHWIGTVNRIVARRWMARVWEAQKEEILTGGITESWPLHWKNNNGYKRKTENCDKESVHFKLTCANITCGVMFLLYSTHTRWATHTRARVATCYNNYDYEVVHMVCLNLAD